MADETVDAVLLSTRFDEQGLDQSAARTLGRVRSQVEEANRQIPPLEIDTEQFRQRLEALGLNVSEFWRGVKIEADEASRSMANSLTRFGGGTPPVVPPIPPAPPNFSPSTPPVINLAEAREVPPVLDRIARGMSFVGSGGEDMARGLRIIRQELDGQAAAARSAATANDRLLAGLNRSGAEARAASAGSEAWARGLANLRGQVQPATVEVERHSRAARLATTALVGMGEEVVGVSSRVGRLAESFVLLSGGEGLVLGIAGTVLVLAKAWELVTAREREEKAERERGVTAFTSRVESQIQTPAVQRLEAQDRLNALKERDQKLTDALNNGELAIVGTLIAKGILLADNNERHRLERDLQFEALQLERERAEAARQRQVTELQNEQALRELRQQGNQADIQGRLAQTQAAGQATFGAQPGALSQEILASYQERLSLSRSSTDAEVANLEAQRAEVAEGLTASHQTEQQLRATQDRITALNQAIAARVIEGENQVQAIRNERELARITAQRIQDEQAHQNRVQAAGGGNRLGAGPQTIDPAAEARELEAREAARLAAIPPIQRGARAQGLIPAAGEAGEIQRVREETARWNDELSQAVIQSEQAFRDAAPARLASTLQDMASGVDIVRQVGNEFGFLGDQAQEALGHVEDILTSIASGNVAGIISGGFSLLGSIFGGGGPSDRDLAIEVMRDNTAQMARLTDQLDGFGRTVGDISATREEATRLRTDIAPGLQPGDRLSAAQAEAFRQTLAESGQTVESWAARIQQLTGLDILDAKGHVVAAALDDVNKALRQLEEDAVSAGQGFTEQLDLTRLRQQIVGGPQTSADAFGQEVGLAIERSPAIAQAFRGVNVQDPGAVRAASLTLLDQFRSGAFREHPEVFGQLSEDEFLQFLRDSAGYLGEFGDAAQKATGQLQDFNLPPGFRRELTAFESMDFGPSRQTTAAARTGTPDFIPGAQTPVAGDGAQLPVDSIAQIIAKVSRPVEIHVHLPDGASPAPGVVADIEEAVRQALYQIGVNQSGDSLQIGLQG